jgi:hypothetical protein
MPPFPTRRPLLSDRKTDDSDFSHKKERGDDGDEKEIAHIVSRERERERKERSCVAEPSAIYMRACA